jgi:ADP-ribose pyrophosphatase YjhB (NUDIX family)
VIERHYASVVIRGDRGTFLTVHHSQKAEHPWRFPGGKLDKGELPIAAAARELYEEMGVVAEHLKLVAVHRTEVDGGIWVGHFFLVGSYTGTIEIAEPEKHDDWCYLTTAELKALDSFPEHVVAAELYYADFPTS